MIKIYKCINIKYLILLLDNPSSLKIVLKQNAFRYPFITEDY